MRKLLRVNPEVKGQNPGGTNGAKSSFFGRFGQINVTKYYRGGPRASDASV